MAGFMRDPSPARVEETCKREKRRGVSLRLVVAGKHATATAEHFPKSVFAASGGCFFVFENREKEGIT